ncbi:MAG TPA: hypothetical protein VGA68_01760 [Woeseiaceae bacterium]|jgi:ABC-type transport system involved in cytochrome c biogenesis permease subunit
MSEKVQNAVPRSFWVISGIALVWNLLGVLAFVTHMTMTEDALAELPEAQRMFYESIPAWADGAFAVAVFGGALGSLLLLLRKSLAVPVFIASLAGLLVQMYHSFIMAGGIDIFGPGALMLPGLTLVIAVFLVWYSRSASSKAWIS